MTKKNKIGFLSVTALMLLLTSCGGINPTTQVTTGTNTGAPTTSATSAQPVDAKYTYNAYLSGSPKTWNVHTWEENTDSYIQSFTEMGFYDCIYDKAPDGKEGYKFVCEMASEFPIQVPAAQITDEEIERYDIKGNPAAGSIWDIKLNKNAVYEDGTPITAEEYIQSMERQLNPKMVNRRADSYYSGSMVLVNAERYFKQQRETEEPAYNYFKDATSDAPTNKNFANDGIFYLNLGQYTPYAESVFSNIDYDSANFYTVLNNRSGTLNDAAELAAQRITDCAKYYCWKYVTHSETDENWKDVKKFSDIKSDATALNAYMNVNKIDVQKVRVRKAKDVGINEEDPTTYVEYSSKALKADLKTFVSAIGNGRGAAGKAWAWKLPLFGMLFNDDKLDFEKVGIEKIDDYTIRLFLTKPMTELDFKFSMTGNWLVYLPLYDGLKQDIGGLVATKYATDNASNYKGYGPYRLTYFKTDDCFTLTRNEKWYGWTDGEHEGQFQMTDLKCRIIKTHQTVKEEFKKGLLDEFNLERSDMQELGNSSRIQYTPESYTTKISFNTSRAKLASRQTDGTNKTILANFNFRKGISLIIDRKELIKFTTGSQAYNYLLNTLYLTEVESGETYRNTEAAKTVYGQVYDTLGGEHGGEVLPESAKGYNYKYGVNLMAEGLAEELALGADDKNYIQKGDKVEIEFRVFDDESEVTKDLWNYLNNTFHAAGQEIGLDISIKLVKDEDYYNSAKQGNFDMIFSTWGGAAINPWGLMEVYCDKTFDSCCEYGFAGQQDKAFLDIDVDGDGQISAEENKSFHEWYKYLNDELIDEIKQDGEDDETFAQRFAVTHSKRLNILAGLEAGIINRFEAIPLYARNSADITSFKVDYATDTYINLIGYGGIRFMRFNYTDAEWEDAIKTGKITYEMYME